MNEKKYKYQYIMPRHSNKGENLEYLGISWKACYPSV
jgi:hypothetical protein